MRTITAKFKSTCAETGQTIAKGEQCLYDPNAKKCYSLNSKKANDHTDYDPAAGMIAANEEAYFDNWYQNNY